MIFGRPKGQRVSGESDNLTPAGGRPVARTRVPRVAGAEARLGARKPVDVRRARLDAGGAGEIHGVLAEMRFVLHGQVQAFPCDEADLVWGEGLAAVRNRPAEVLLPQLDESDVAADGLAVLANRSRNEVLALLGLDREVEVAELGERRERDGSIHEKHFVEAPGVGRRLDDGPGPHLPIGRGLHAAAVIGDLVETGLDQPLHELGGLENLALGGLHLVAFQDEPAVEEGLQHGPIDHLLMMRTPPFHELHELLVRKLFPCHLTSSLTLRYTASSVPEQRGSTLGQKLSRQRRAGPSSGRARLLARTNSG